LRELIRQKYILTVALVVLKRSRMFGRVVLVDHGQPFHCPLRECLSAIRPYQGALECYGSTLDREVSMTEADLYVFMARHRLGILATICPNATPQSALMGIAITPQLEIVFDTVKSSRKYPNLIARPACSFVIGGWGAGEQTVQYEGEAQELKSPDLERYQTIYFQVWPDGPERMRWPGIVYFIVRPTWIRYSDFDQNPPLIREFIFRSGRAAQA